MKRPEQALQTACVTWLEIQRRYKKLTYFHVPNGGWRGKREAWVLKQMGVRAGIPDLVIGLPGGVIFFVELKAPKGRMSLAQREMHEELYSYGFRVFIIKSLDELIEKIQTLTKGDGHAESRRLPEPEAHGIGRIPLPE